MPRHLFAAAAVLGTFAAGPAHAEIGDVLASYTLPGVDKIRGIAFDDTTDLAYVLDDESGAEKVHVFHWTPQLGLTATGAVFAVPNGPAGQVFDVGTGLAVATENGNTVLYLLQSIEDTATGAFDSDIFRVKQVAGVWTTTHVIDLNAPVFELLDAEVYDISADASGRLLVGWNKNVIPCVPGASVACDGVDSENLMRARGLRRFKVSGSCPAGAPAQCHLQWAVSGDTKLRRSHLRDSGRALDDTYYTARGVAFFLFDDAPYLVLSMEHDDADNGDKLYVADGETARGLFQFNAPPLDGAYDNTERKLAVGAGYLWATRKMPDLDDVVDRIRLTTDLDVPHQGTKYPRKLEMTQVASGGSLNPPTPAWDHLNFGRPSKNGVRPNQDALIWSVELDMSAGGQEVSWYYEPGGAEQGEVVSAQFPTLLGMTSEATFTVDFYHSEYRHYVYPHRAVDDHQNAFDPGSDFALGQTEDTQMFRFQQNAATVYAPFIDLVVAYIAKKYETPESQVDMLNPYWAARNVAEYLRDNFNYPMDAEAHVPGDDIGYVTAMSDVDSWDEASTPAYWKLSYSFVDLADTDTAFCSCDPATAPGGVCERLGAYRRVLMCASANGAFVGAMRYLGLPARWVGTSAHRGNSSDPNESCATFEEGGDELSSFCDENGNGVFDGDDYMFASNGHMTSEVWLGETYGWQRFEATPELPGDTNNGGIPNLCLDYARIHSVEPQESWVLNYKGAARGMQAKAVATSMGVGYEEAFFEDHQDNQALSCGDGDRCHGDTSYNMTHRTSHPVERDASEAIRWLPTLGFEVEVTPGVGEYFVDAVPTGPWDELLPDALVEIAAHEYLSDSDDDIVLVSNLAWDSVSGVAFTTDLYGLYYIQVRRQDEDRVVGGASELIYF